MNTLVVFPLANTNLLMQNLCDSQNDTLTALKNFLPFLLGLALIACQESESSDGLPLVEIEEDLAYLDSVLQSRSSYQGLNGYDYAEDFLEFLELAENQSVTKADFQRFLTETIGLLGDRHASVRGDRVRDSLFLPLAFAPYQGKVLVLTYDRDIRQFRYWDKEYPFLKGINHIPVVELLPKVSPRDARAPEKSYALTAVRELRDIQKICTRLSMKLPEAMPIVLANERGEEKEVAIDVVGKQGRGRYWDERFYRRIYSLGDDDYQDTATIERFFRIEDNIAYIQIPDMVEREESPLFFDKLSSFMDEARQTDGLVVDVRDNGGGTRDLINELAGYFIHPDSIYVVNATRQRGALPLDQEAKESLNGRYLFARNELSPEEQATADRFMTSFTPMYTLDDSKYSEYHYFVLNGGKLTEGKYHYTRPIYLLANERSFSAASVFVSVCKGLPNVTLAGVTTDGSSGNSRYFDLPHSEITVKLSSMVSFQKDGQILDGYGTQPDVLIERNLDQIFWKEDYQLRRVKELILE